MSTKTLARAVVTLGMVFGLALHARAEEIKITVEVDETTSGDADRTGRS